MRNLIIYLLILQFSAPAFSQQQTDTIELQIRNLHGEKKLDFLIRSASAKTNLSPDMMISYAGLALKLAEELKRPDKSAEACILLSEGYLNANKSDSALFFAQKSLKLYRSSFDSEGIIMASNKLGLAFLSQGNTEMAEKIFIQTFNDCRLYLQKKPAGQQVKDLIAEIFNNLTLTYVKQGNYLKAKEKMLQFNKKHDYGKTYTGVVIFRNLANIYQTLGDFDSSLVYANHALSIAQSLKDPLSTGRIYIDIGTTHYYMGKCSEALNYYEKAKEVLLPVNDQLQMAKLYNNMASTYNQISYYEKATDYFFKSVRIKEELADSDGMAATYNNLALAYFNWDNNEMTSYFLRKALLINLKRKNKKYLATNYTALGDLYVDLKKSDSALFYYQKSLEFKKELGNKYGIVISLHCLGDVYADLLMNESMAIEYYQQALDMASSIGSGFEIASISASLGVLLYKKGQLSAADELFRNAFGYASEENALELIYKSARYLTEISIQRGDKSAALDYFSRFRITGDSLFSEDKTKTILEMQTRFETLKKEQENLVLQKTNDFQKSQIKLLIVVAVILLFLGFVILFLYRQKSRAYKQIVHRNLEIVKAEKRMETNMAMNAADGHAMVLPPYGDIDNTTLGLLVKFNRLMSDEKPYLEAGLTVDDVCRKIHTNRSYLAQMIHENFNQNFNGFINELRIKEARRLLTESKYDHLSIEGIGEMVGFKTKATFHSIFKKQIGITPSYFRNSIDRSSLS